MAHRDKAHHHDPPEAGTYGILFGEIQSLRKEVDDLKSKADSESRGPLAWAKRWEVWLTLIVAVFALPRGGVDLYHVIRNRPNSKLTPGNTLSMTYNPRESKLQFVFDFSADNIGTEDDLLDPRGELSDKESAPNYSWPFSATDFTCSSAGARLPAPFPLRVGIPISIECSLSATLPGKSSSFFRPGDHILAVTFQGAHDTKHSLKFCFSATKAMLDEVFGSGQEEGRRFIYPYCPDYREGE